MNNLREKVSRGLCWALGFVLLFLACLVVTTFVLAVARVFINVFFWIDWLLIIGGALIWAALLFAYFLFSDRGAKIQARYVRGQD